MDVQLASGLVAFLREGGLLAALVLAILAVVYMFKKLIAEKDAHRQTSDVVVKLATELAGLVRDMNAKRNPRSRPSPQARPASNEGPENGGSGPTHGD